MALDLKDREWSEFFIEEIADICSGKDIIEKERLKGKIPFITATSINNGIGDFIGNINRSIASNCLSVNRTGSVGYAFFHKYKALYSNNCRKLILKKNNEYIGKFIAFVVSFQKEKYSYGYILGTERLMRQKLLLPVNSKGEPDYVFMEQYMCEQESAKAKDYLAYIAKRVKKLENIPAVEPLSMKKWHEFFIEDIFFIKSGVRLTKASMKQGNMPFIGATDSNNGITGFISNTNKSLDSNVLGVNYNGSVVENFYHPYKAVFSDDVKRLSLKYQKGNRSIYLFIKSVILKQKIKYQYAYKFNGERMARQKIMLPINSEGKPDYEYMEHYMKALEYQKLKIYLDRKK